MDIPVVHQTNLLFADFFMIWIVESRWMKNLSVGRTFQFLGPIEKKKTPGNDHISLGNSENHQKWQRLKGICGPLGNLKNKFRVGRTHGISTITSTCACF